MGKKEITLLVSDETRNALASFAKANDRTLVSVLREGLLLAADKYQFVLPDLSIKPRAKGLAGPSVKLKPTVPKATADALKQIATASGQPVSALVREALDSFVDAKLTRSPKSA